MAALTLSCIAATSSLEPDPQRVITLSACVNGTSHAIDDQALTVGQKAHLRRFGRNNSQGSRTRLRGVAYLLALLASRRLWPAPMTAPLAAFPPIAPIAAPFAAPLALGWVVSFGGGCVAAGGVFAGGGVCASTAGITALESAIRKDITLAECFIMASFLAGLLCPGAHTCHLRPAGALLKFLVYSL